MKILAQTGREDIALVSVAETGSGRLVEFVESLQPPLPRDEKWILTVSTLDGCPVRCRFCDAGGPARGALSREDILEQIDHLVRRRYPDGAVPVKKLKIQLARMGEPSLNPHVLEVLEALPGLYDAPGLIPSFSTVAPAGTDGFFERLLDVKNRRYGPRFQMQFSIHTTDGELRDRLIPVKKWPFEKIAAYGMKFIEGDGRKVTLNFALAAGLPVDARALLDVFPTEAFLVKMTPVNPTREAARNGISSTDGSLEDTAARLREAGYEVLVSIGELEENRIGSNCGMYINQFRGPKASN
ncbi:MAG: radical SAM protein [Candidatus Aminicenantes bacterium]|nr:radical SAM protein [Candidatus Aminicenantes bacterium]